VARTVFVGDRHNSAEAFQPFPDDFGDVTGGSATEPTASPRGGETYLGPAGTAANQAVSAASPVLGTLQQQAARLEMTVVPAPAQSFRPSPNTNQTWMLRRPRTPFIE
jgi:hypothetical protein